MEITQLSELEVAIRKMRIETWKSNKGDEEIHHFVEGEYNTYLFGWNEKLLGTDLYNEVLQLVASKLKDKKDEDKKDNE